MTDLVTDITGFLYKEVLALDERRWDDWLAHFAEDCEYWVPTWKSEDELTDDPQRELSLIYYATRAGLEDRVWRVKSARSVASAVLPRTQHVINNVVVLEQSAEQVKVACAWTVHQYLPKEKTVELFFGRYEQTLTRQGASWLIDKKKIILLNDYLPAKLDFYNF